MFSLYLEEKTVPALLDRLERENIRTAARYSAKGNHFGNRPFTRGHLYKLLANPIYIGRVPHRDTSYRGKHEAVIDKATWDAVQSLLAGNTQGARVRRRRAKGQTHLLEGLLHAESGARFIPSAANKGSKRYRYYVELPQTDGAETDQLPPTRLPATEIEGAVVTGIQSVLADQRGLLHRLEADGATEAPVVMDGARRLLQALGGRVDADLQAKLRKIVRKVTVGHNRIQLTFSIGSTRAVLGIGRPAGIWPTNEPDDSEFAVVVPFVTARRGRQMKLVLPSTNSGAAPNPSLVTAIVRAWDWAERLKSGEVASLAEICAAEGFTDSYVGQILPLAFLSPELVEQILTGQQPAGLTANKLIWRRRLPLRWDEHIEALRTSA